MESSQRLPIAVAHKAKPRRGRRDQIRSPARPRRSGPDGGKTRVFNKSHKIERRQEEYPGALQRELSRTESSLAFRARKVRGSETACRAAVYDSARQLQGDIVRHTRRDIVKTLAALPLIRLNRADPDVVLYNGLVSTMYPGQPEATALAIRDARFLAVGRDKDVLALAGGRTRRIDLWRGGAYFPASTMRMRIPGWAASLPSRTLPATRARSKKPRQHFVHGRPRRRRGIGCRATSTTTARPRAC